LLLFINTTIAHTQPLTMSAAQELTLTIQQNLQKLAGTFPARFIDFLREVLMGINQQDLTSLNRYSRYIDKLETHVKSNFNLEFVMQNADSDFYGLIHGCTYSNQQISKLASEFRWRMSGIYYRHRAEEIALEVIYLGYFDIFQFLVIQFDLKLNTQKALDKLTTGVLMTKSLYMGKNNELYQKEMTELMEIEKFIHQRSVMSPFLRLSRLLSAKQS